MRYENILEGIGRTPHVRINQLFPGARNVWIKLERDNPGGSIKDRIALAMVRDAEEQGVLKSGSTIIEPTSGNTGIGLAMVAAVKGYRIILVMPESMSVERRNILRAYGAEIVLTPRELGMKGSMEKAKELAREIKGAWIPSQFDNPSNPSIHESTTALEILEDFPTGIDYLVTGVGTGGHISGVSRVLKQKMPGIRIIAVEPIDSPVISGGEPGPHGIMGIGAGFIPGNLDRDLIDAVLQIKKEEAYDFARRLAKEEGIFAGISTGASLAAVSKLMEKEGDSATILTFSYDTGERYLSVNDLF
ncbi:MAG: cysteine synthase A [Bacteroidetes bacterium]|nr:MAG: cysteine synthase A [Bacteroidota bacterium]RLD95118.1 MAG: cysteine synthase A [Bacteroidota bacterium]RLE06398.1 MAG: cysteine synthase A [Bacteroidota bacterium]